MKIKLLTCLLILLLGVPLMAAPPTGRSAVQTAPLTVDNTTYIDANRILMFVTNHGSFGRDLAGVFGNDYGTYWPFSTTAAIIDGSNKTSPYYAGGLWVGAVDSATGDTLVCLSEYASEYVPGPMSGGTFMTDRPAFRVYKLYSDSLGDNANQDLLDWPYDQGAPTDVVDTIVDTSATPDDTTYALRLGDQFCWSICNDADTSAHHGNVDAGETNPLGLEVRQSIFAFNQSNPLGDIVFIRLQIVNKGGNTLQNCFFSLWSDPDLGGSGDDLVGCDTLLGLAFCYNESNNDQKYSPQPPPALGLDFFQGPLQYTGDPDDVARMWGQTWPGYRNMGLYSFNKYINGTDPDNNVEAYMFMEGLDAKHGGAPYVYNGDTLLFVCSGDPVARTGDLDHAGDDRRMMQTTGPITFRPDDSTEIVAALIVGQGGDRLSSVSVMKYNDRFAQLAYDSNFVVPKPPAEPVVTATVLANQVSLQWTDNSEVDHGDYPFQGYSVYQGEQVGNNIEWTRIANYDVVDGVSVIMDEVLNPVTSVLETRAVKFGSDNGLMRYFLVDEDYINGGRLHNLTTYYFKVEAYSYNLDGIPKTMTSSASAHAAMPQDPIPNVRFQYAFGDTVSVTHDGLSDGIVLPFVVNSTQMDGDTYQVTFTDTTTPDGDLAWHLVDLTTGDTVIGWQWNQAGDSTVKDIPGAEVLVSGPALALRNYQYFSHDTAATAPFAGVNWNLTFLGGGIGLAADFQGSEALPSEFRTVEIRFGEGTQKAYCYRRDAGYGYDGFFEQPFTVWDITADPPRQINFCFVENYNLADDNGQVVDSVWNPWTRMAAGDTTVAPLGGREYGNVMSSTYSDTALDVYKDAYGQTTDALYSLGLKGIIIDTATHATGAPAEGDIIRLTPYFVNTSSDVFTFTMSDSTLLSPQEALLNNIRAVPNPFYLYGPYDPAVGNTQIYFSNLPERCTITIYNLAGDYINKIEKNDASTSMAYWNVRTENNLPVGSGIYIYVVDAPGFGQKIGKMAVFTEQQVLDIY